MEMNEQFLKLITFLNALQATGRFTVFYSYSGHVNWLCIAIYKGKWNEKKKAIFSQDYKIQNGVMTIFHQGETTPEEIIQSINSKIKLQ
nr:hypothetical protein [uncultured Butyricimonas sp.]